MAIRRMQREDVAAISKLEAETFSMPWSEDAFLEMIENKDAHYLVTEKDGQLIGCCGLRNIVGEGEITNVVVKESYRNLHIGRAMLTQLLRIGEDLGITAFTLEVRKSNAAAIHLYEALGFACEGIRRDFYEKPIEDGLIMWKR